MTATKSSVHRDAGRPRTVSALAGRLSERMPAMDYPPLNGFSVSVHGTCGIGHRLLRNAKIFHAARAMGYGVGIGWFPWSELFGDEADLFAMSNSGTPAYRFGNEPSEISPVSLPPNEPEITVYQHLEIPLSLDFDYAGCPDEGRWEREVFGPAATDHLADFHLRLMSQLRPRWANRIDRFVSDEIADRRIVAIHVRTGNGETGDFADKNRGVKTNEIMANLVRELDRFRREETAVFVASDSVEPAEFLRAETGHDVSVFAKALPQSGFATGDWMSPNSSDDIAEQGPAERVEQFFEAYADMLLLGMADDLYAGAWSSFLAAPFLMNRRRADLGTTLSIHDSNTGQLRPV